jgi:hypothetical protein
MNKKQFTDKLLANGFTASPFNTNNAWGFGGGVGTSYKRGKQGVRVGVAYYRHHPPASFMSLDISDGKGRQGITPRQLDSACQELGLE